MNFRQWRQWVIREGVAWSCCGQATIAARIHAVFVEQWWKIQWVLFEIISRFLLDRRCRLFWQGELSIHHDKDRWCYLGCWSLIVNCLDGGVSSCTWLFVWSNCCWSEWWSKRTASVWSDCVKGRCVNREGNYLQTIGLNCETVNRTYCLS